MNSKRKLHHFWTRIRPVSYWHFLALAIISGLVAIYALRQNNLTAITLRENVMTVDKENGDTEKALRELRNYVHSHMNTDLSSGPTAIKPSVQLKHRYERLVQEQEEKVSAQNEKIYTEAQTICERRHPAGFSGSGRISCIEEYVSKNRIKQESIPDSLYKFSFTSPRWSPDLAGFSLVATGLFLFLFMVRFGLELWLKKQLE